MFISFITINHKLRFFVPISELISHMFIMLSTNKSQDVLKSSYQYSFTGGFVDTSSLSYKY